MPVTVVEDTTIPGPCPEKSKSGRSCLLGAGHTIKHRYTAPRQEVPALASVLGAGTLKRTIITGDKVSARIHGGKSIVRDALQVQIDLDAAANAAANKGLTADVPLEKFKAVVRYTVPVKAVEATLAYIRRSATTGGPVTSKVLKYRKDVHANGNVSIQWGYVDPKKD